MKHLGLIMDSSRLESRTEIYKINSQLFQSDLSTITADILNYNGPNIALEYNKKLSMILSNHAPLVSK